MPSSIQCAKKQRVATLRSELVDVERKLRELAEAGRLDELVSMVIDLLAKVQRDNSLLTARLQAALRQLYGRKGEKVPTGQLALLFEALGAEAPQAAQDVVAEAVAHGDDGAVPQPQPPAPSPGKQGGKRTPLSDRLPRRKRIIRVHEALRVCGTCGRDKTPIGTLRSEVLEFVPAHFLVVEEHREKLACKTCGNGVVTAPSHKPMDRGRPGPGLLAAVVVAKGQDSLPLYRQCQIYQRGEVKLSDSTLGDWFAFAADALEPLARRLRTLVLEAAVLGADDTGLPVQEKNDARRKTRRGHLWAYVGYRDDGRLVVFDYTPTWAATGPRQFLQGYRGVLQGDGYAGFRQALTRERGDPVVSEESRLACGMHIRRKFEAASEAGDARGAVALAYFRKLYDVERQCKQEGLSPDERHARRQEQSLPVLDELYRWVHQVHPQVIPGDRLHEATRYALQEEQRFRRCFSDGRFELDNGEVERQLRRVAIGRKNYLFAGSDRAAHRLAVVYTLLGTCHLHQVEPLSYLADVIDKLQNGWPAARIDDLLPHLWHKPDRPYWRQFEDLEALPPVADPTCGAPPS